MRVGVAALAHGCENPSNSLEVRGAGSPETCPEKRFHPLPLYLVLISLLAVPAFALQGDVNLDGAVNSLDVDALSEFLVGKTNTLPSTVNADVNFDSALNAQDPLILLQFVRGLRPALPPSPVTIIHVSGLLTGTLSGPRTVYVVDANVQVPVGGTLIWGAGVVIKMSTGTNITVAGTLLSEGTPADPVILTSLADDSVLGDTGGNGPSQGVPGQWGQLTFQSGASASRLSNTQIRFGLRTTLVSSSPEFIGVLFSSMSGVALQADPNSIPRGSGNTAWGSPINGIDKRPGGTLKTQAWENLGIPYVLRAGGLGIGGPVTLQPGVVVKLFGPGFIEFGARLTAIGTASNPIVFTSLRDDSVGGNTNGSEGSVSPAPNDWPAVYMDGNVSGSEIRFMRMRFAGNGLFTFDTASPSVHSSIFEYNAFSAIENQDPAVTIDATGNYWGSPTGPTHAGNPGGTGNAVIGNVTYVPFLGSEPF